jgi:acetyltransferase-like isoleucine patch superfamily enzyme
MLNFVRRNTRLKLLVWPLWCAVRPIFRPWQLLFTLYYRLRLRRCGRRVDFSTTMIIRNPRNIEIGDNCSFSNFVILDGHDRITIGSNCMLANNVVIATATHDETVDPMNSVTIRRPVTIGNNVWFGIGATILPGLNIGDGAIIGARALVTKDVPAGAVVIGIPAQIVRFRNHQEKTA